MPHHRHSKSVRASTSGVVVGTTKRDDGDVKKERAKGDEEEKKKKKKEEKDRDESDDESDDEDDDDKGSTVSSDDGDESLEDDEDLHGLPLIDSEMEVELLHSLAGPKLPPTHPQAPYGGEKRDPIDHLDYQGHTIHRSRKGASVMAVLKAHRAQRWRKAQRWANEKRESLRNAYRQYFTRTDIGVWMCLYWAANITLFNWWFLMVVFDVLPGNWFSVVGLGYAISRGSAVVALWNASLLVLCFCRHTITLLQVLTTRFIHPRVFPFDELRVFHQHCAYVMVAASIVHTIAHTSNFIIIGNFSSDSELEDAVGLFAYDGFDSVPEWWQFVISPPVVTGVAMCVALTLIVCTAQSWVRRRFFELFYYTHHLFVLFYACLLFHGMGIVYGMIPIAWAVLLPPLALYSMERLFRLIRRFANTPILSYRRFHGDVLQLSIRKPPLWRGQAGQYITLCVPQLSRLQYHPFTLTSSPGEDVLTVHIKRLGDWTEKLHALCRTDDCTMEHIARRAAWSGSRYVAVDGPFGAPTNDYHRYKELILVGAGIGVTPFASVLKDICRRAAQPATRSKVERVFFFWLNSAPTSFSWFAKVLQQAAEDAEKIGFPVIIRTYLTRAIASKNMRSIVTWNLLDVLRQQEGRDPLTGVPASTLWGRPDWDQIFESFSLSAKRVFSKPRRVGVFYCGPLGLEEEIRRMCHRYSTPRQPLVFRSEKFS